MGRFPSAVRNMCPGAVLTAATVAMAGTSFSSPILPNTAFWICVTGGGREHLPEGTEGPKTGTADGVRICSFRFLRGPLSGMPGADCWLI